MWKKQTKSLTAFLLTSRDRDKQGWYVCFACHDYEKKLCSCFHMCLIYSSPALVSFSDLCLFIFILFSPPPTFMKKFSTRACKCTLREIRREKGCCNLALKTYKEKRGMICLFETPPSSFSSVSKKKNI